jgi:hypothetical protein
MSLTVMNKT